MTSESNPVPMAITNSRVLPASCKKEIILPADQECYFTNYIYDFTCEFEALRRKSMMVCKQRCWFTVILIVFVTINIVASYRWGIVTIFYVFIFAFSFIIMTGKWTEAATCKYNKKVKSKVFPVMFKYFGDEFFYSRVCPWSIKKMKRFKLLPSYNAERIYNYVKGTYNNIEIEMVEVELTQESDDSSKIRFKGILLLLTPKKIFSGRVVIKRANRGFMKSGGHARCTFRGPKV